MVFFFFLGWDSSGPCYLLLEETWAPYIHLLFLSNTLSWKFCNVFKSESLRFDRRAQPSPSESGLRGRMNLSIHLFVICHKLLHYCLLINILAQALCYSRSADTRLRKIEQRSNYSCHLLKGTVPSGFFPWLLLFWRNNED